MEAVHVNRMLAPETIADGLVGTVGAERELPRPLRVESFMVPVVVRCRVPEKEVGPLGVKVTVMGQLAAGAMGEVQPLAVMVNTEGLAV